MVRYYEQTPGASSSKVVLDPHQEASSQVASVEAQPRNDEFTQVSDILDPPCLFCFAEPCDFIDAVNAYCWQGDAISDQEFLRRAEMYYEEGCPLEAIARAWEEAEEWARRERERSGTSEASHTGEEMDHPAPLGSIGADAEARASEWYPYFGYLHLAATLRTMAPASLLPAPLPSPPTTISPSALMTPPPGFADDLPAYPEAQVGLYAEAWGSFPVEDPANVGDTPVPALEDSDRSNHSTAVPSAGNTVDDSQAKTKRASKRKRGEGENLPTVIPAAGPSRPTRRAAQNAQPQAGLSREAGTSEEPEAGPPRKRRKEEELEDIEMPPKTRCGLDGCDAIHTAPNLTAARKHFHSHFAPSPSTTADSKVDGADPKGKKATQSKDKGKGKATDKGKAKDKGKGKEVQKQNADGETKAKLEKKKWKCPHMTPEGVQCSHPANAKGGFADLLALRRHVEGSHYGWGFRCEGCGTLFPRRDALTRHYTTHPACDPAA